MMKTTLLHRATLLVFVTLFGCGHESNVPVAPVTASGAASSSPDVTKPAGSAAPEMAPTPYSAEEIRNANQPGTIYRYKVETSGSPLELKVLEFTLGTSAESAEVKEQSLDEAGQPKGPAKVGRSSWEDVRRHAEFPRAGLKVEPGSIEVPAGKFEAMVYTVSAPNGDTMRFYFAKSYAGPPVLFYKEHGGARVMTSTLIERRAGPTGRPTP
jgi:hypothetical protein